MTLDPDAPMQISALDHLGTVETALVEGGMVRGSNSSQVIRTRVDTAIRVLRRLRVYL